tara:strand:- start:1245 stop:1433 length:189 start_codon:yes stop_codon:yes gene_type:complete
MNNITINYIVKDLNTMIQKLENKIKVYDKQEEKLKLEKPPAGLPSNLRINKSILKWSGSLRN